MPSFVFHRMDGGRYEGMTPFNSIKWRLQIWYGLILVAVLLGFGLMAYQLEYGQRMRQIDGELQRRFRVVADALRGNAGPGGHPRPGRPGPIDDFPSQHPNGGDTKFELPAFALGLFGTNQPGNFYFLVKSRDGQEIARGGDIPSYEPFGESSHRYINRMPAMEEVRPGTPRPPPAFTDGKFREIWDRAPSGEDIHVGCSIAQSLTELHRTALEFILIGALILFCGLAIGGRLVSRAIRPINSISDAAVKISAGDLSQRINVADAESELGKLAAVLNSTFARLDASFAQQKQFASDAAHELRTPVSVILTQAQTALNREREAKEYRETIEACQRAAQRMKRLISALLELTRLDAGQEHFKRKRFSLTDAVRESVEMIRPIAEERHLKLTSELAPVEITGDARRLEQVVTNLLTNAIQYNKANGEIRVKLETHNGLAMLSVADTGQGIAEEDRPHVFKRFYRGDKSRTGVSNAGLGLAICKAIVEAHSGTIEVTSEEDVGTTFTVRLPI